MEELKLCPFCGAHEISFDYRYAGKTYRRGYRTDCGITFLVCDVCGAKTKAFGYDPDDAEDRTLAEEKAIAAWNRRADNG